MRHHITHRMVPARARTRVLTPLVNTRQVTRTLRVNRTLGAAIGGPSDVVGLTGADRRLTSGPADRVRTARRRDARVAVLYHHHGRLV